MQRIDPSIALDGGNVPMISNKSKKRKRKQVMVLELIKEAKTLRKKISSSSYASECSYIRQQIRESERALCDLNMEKMEVMHKLEEMEENPNMYTAKAIKRQRDREALLENFIQSETSRLERSHEELNRIRARKENGSTKKKGSNRKKAIIYLNLRRG
ncbi:predicted protein [Chaetoceros tenuissimus]|uniref:Uncharacterized protein n=1 Tax=Chaetoceros tenuissimus TaxID=426638 RepID=A0AAD3GZD0_9STRA|nr:predicted protein [Chaetoceros tenuissimus]